MRDDTRKKRIAGIILVGLLSVVALIVVIVKLSLMKDDDPGKTLGIELPGVVILNEHQGPLRYLAFSPDSKILACYNSSDAGPGYSDDITIWQLTTGRKLAFIPDPMFQTMAFSSEGKSLATTHADSIIRLWDTSTWDSQAKHFEEFTGGPIFWLDSTKLALWKSGAVTVCDLETGKRGSHFSSGPASVTETSITPIGNLVAIADIVDRSIKVWDIASGKMQWSFVAHLDRRGGGGPSCVAFSPNGKWLASAGGDHTVRLWDIASKEQVASYRVFRSGTSALAFSPDGKLLAAGDQAGPKSPGQVLVWDLTKGKCLGIWKTRTGVLQLAFSPDGKTLAVGSKDHIGFVELWSVEEMLGRKPAQGGGDILN